MKNESGANGHCLRGTDRRIWSGQHHTGVRSNARLNLEAARPPYGGFLAHSRHFIFFGRADQPAEQFPARREAKNVQAANPKPSASAAAFTTAKLAETRSSSGYY